MRLGETVRVRVKTVSFGRGKARGGGGLLRGGLSYTEGVKSLREAMRHKTNQNND